MSEFGGEFGFGLIDDPGIVGSPVPIAGESESIPESFSLESYNPRVLYQRGTGGCVGCAFAIAIELRAQIMGIKLDEVSWLAIYTMARLAYDATLIDVGSRPSGGADMLERKGIVSEKTWPSNDNATVNTPLPWDVYQHAAPAKVQGLYRCDNLDSVRLTLSRGFPVVYDQTVDQAYIDYTSGLYVEGGPVRGRHMQILLGYEPGRFRVQSSWGTRWGERGRSWVPESIVDRAMSRYAIPIAPQEIS